MVSYIVVVTLSVGLHVRLTALLTEVVDDPGVDVTIAFDGGEADAASPFEIMILGVGHGDEVTLSTNDDSAGVALDSLVELLSRDLDEE